MKPRVPDGVRIYAIGDVHGCADLLISLLARIDIDLEVYPIAHPVEVFLGDYIDRGPKSPEVVDLLIERRKQRVAVCLKGNHEAYATRVLSNPSLLPRWRELGGVNTLLSYGVAPSTSEDPYELKESVKALRRALPEHHHQFLNSLALSFSSGDFFLAHAGVRPGISLGLQSQRDLLWIRQDFLQYQEDFGKIVVHGHTPVDEPDLRSNRINIDTGAYATGRLSCLVLEGTQIRFI